MTVLNFESSPQVELRHDQALTPEHFAALTAANATTDAREAYKHALIAYQVYAIKNLREELINKTIIEDTVIRRAMDNLWMLYSPIFKKATGPMIAQAMIEAFRETQAGEVPIHLVYALAEEHAERVGLYFHQTSGDALIEGFNTYVNRQVPARAALERVLDAYGLTPRQMRGYTSAVALQPLKVDSTIPQKLKRKAKEYIASAFSQRLKVFTGQEAHNLDSQAQQIAWMYLLENNRMPQETQKIWLTAEDEKVCKVCGPMHRKRVKVGERFTMPDQSKLYVPGAHVNCRCRVQLFINPFSVVQKAAWEPKEHPRGGNPENRGQFSRKPREAYAEAPSPALEAMLRQVEEARRTAQAQQPVEPLKPTVLTPKVQPRLAPPPMARPEVTKPVLRPNLAKAPKLSPQVAPQAVEQKPALTPKLLAGPMLTPQPLQLTPQVDYQGLVQDQDQRWSAFQTIEMGPVKNRPTRPITDMYGNHVPGFTVTSGAEMMDYHNKAQLTDNDPVKLFRSPSDAIAWRQREITMTHDQAVTEKFYEILDSFNNHYDTADEETYIELEDEFEYEADNGEMTPSRHTALVPLQIVQEVVERMAWDNPAYGQHEDLMLPDYELTWVDDDGEVVNEELLNTRELAEYLGVDGDEVRPTVLRLEEGYDNAYQEDDDYWKAPGVYTVVNHTFKTLELPNGQQVPYMEADLRPQVNEKTVYEPRYNSD